MEHRAGFVALLGKPNVGKSTLVNAIVGQKVSIVSDKPQTTRKRILGIATTPDYQIVFVDTPGIHEPHTELGKRMVAAARSALTDVQVVVIVVDSSRMPNAEDESLARLLAQANWLGSDNCILCLNKMDLLKAVDVQKHVDAYTKLFNKESYMLTSLTKNQNVDKLLEMIVQRLPESTDFYAADEFTDQPMRSIAAELIREKAMRLTRQEVPHALATVVDEWNEDDKIVRIAVSIVVEKEGQKAILIGNRGAMLKQIGTEARIEIEELLEKRVFLELFVKVRQDWRQNPRMLSDLELTES